MKPSRIKVRFVTEWSDRNKLWFGYVYIDDKKHHTSVTGRDEVEAMRNVMLLYQEQLG